MISKRIFLALSLLFPSVILANAIIPITNMVTGFPSSYEARAFTVAFILIVIIEGIFLKRAFKIENWKSSFLLSFIANLSSSLIGNVILFFIGGVVFDNFVRNFLIFFIATFFTELLVIELNVRPPLRKSILITLISNLISYSLLLVFLLVFMQVQYFYSKYNHQTNIKQWSNRTILKDQKGYLLFKNRNIGNEFEIYSFRDFSIIKTYKHDSFGNTNCVLADVLLNVKEILQDKRNLNFKFSNLPSRSSCYLSPTYEKILLIKNVTDLKSPRRNDYYSFLGSVGEGEVYEYQNNNYILKSKPPGQILNQRPVWMDDELLLTYFEGCSQKTVDDFECNSFKPSFKKWSSQLTHFSDEHFEKPYFHNGIIYFIKDSNLRSWDLKTKKSRIILKDHINDFIIIPNSNLIVANIPYSIFMFRSNYIVVIDINNVENRFLVSKDAAYSGIMYTK